MREEGARGVITRKSVLPLAIAALTTVQVTSLFSLLVQTELVRQTASQLAGSRDVESWLDWTGVWFPMSRQQPTTRPLFT